MAASHACLVASATGTGTILDNDDRRVRAEESRPRAFRIEPTAGAITLRRYDDGDPSQPVTVYFTIAGTAVPGEDYERLEGTTEEDPLTGEITIPEDELTYTLWVTPLAAADPEAGPEPTKTVVLEIQEHPDAPSAATYLPGEPTKATVTIDDRDRISPHPVYCVPSRCCLLMCGADDVVAVVDDQTATVIIMILKEGKINRSNDNPHPIFTVDVVFPESTQDATSIVAKLKFADVDSPPVVYSPAGLVAGEPYRFALQADASGLADGHYEWELTVTEHYEDVPPLSHTYTGWRNVQNLIDSPLGNRWRLGYVDRLAVQDAGVLWVGGDGNLFWFYELPDGSYLAPEGQLRGSTLVSNADGTFTLTDRHGGQSHFDQQGLLTSRLDRMGNATTFSYIDLDEDGMPDALSEMVEPGGRTTTFAYSNGRLETSTDFAGRVTAMTYDAAGRLTTVTRPDPDGSGSPELQFTYDSVTSQMTSYTTATGATTTLQYDAAGTLRSRVEPDGATHQFSAALAAGWVDLSSGLGTSETPAPLLKTADVAATRSGPLGANTAATVDRFGFPTSQTDALGQVTRMDRDHQGRVTRLVQPDPDGPGPLPAPETFFAYDSRGNLLQITHADSTTETWTYEPAFNQATSYTDRLGNQTLYQIDSSTGSLLAVQHVVGQVDDPSNGETDDVVTSFTYTAAPSTSGDPPAGLLQTVTDPLGRVTAYEYNGRGLLVQITYAVGTVDEASVEFEYDAADNLTAEIDELGRRTEYTYDNLGRVTAIEGPDPDGNGGPVWTFQYDASGRVVAETDPLGRVTQYTYDSRGKPTAITGPDHDGTPTVTALEYDLAGRLKATVDRLGRRTAFGYDAAGQMTSLTRPDPAGDGSQGGPVTGWSFDPLGRVVSQTDPLGNVTSLAYEDFGRRIVTTHPDPDAGGPLDSPVTVAQYDAAGNLIAATDALDRVTAYAYDPLGRLVRVTHPDPDDPSQPGSETEYQYDKAGNLRFVIDVLGNVTELIYDHRDRLVEMVLPDPDGLGSPQWTYTYDAAGQRLTETDPLGRTTSYQYDALGRVVERTLPDPDGPGPLTAPVYSYAYDLAGNLLSVTDPLNHTTSYTYDDFDRVLTVTDALSGVTGFAYDAAGQLLQRTDPLSRTTAWSYDQLGRTVAVTDPLNQTTAFAYDGVGNLLSVTDPLNHTTSYAYDNLYRRTAVTDPLSGVTSFAYDAAGQLLQQTDPLSRTTAWSYDGLGRVTSVTDPLSQATGYTYDAAGNLLSVTDPLNHTTTYSYDALYRRTAIIDPLAGMTSFTFGLAGNLTSLTDPVGNTTAWDYDGLNRVVAETNELNDSRTFAYDAANNLLTRTDRNGRVIEYDYDALHRRVEEQWLDDQQTVIRTLSFSYDAASQLTAAADPAASYDYQYDALGRRTSVTHDIAGLGFPVVLASAYDAASNRTSLSATIDSTADFVNTYTYDALHRMTRIEQSGQSGGNAVAEKRIDLTYDAAGQYQTITRYTDLAATKLVATSDYTFDAAGRLTGLTHARQLPLPLGEGGGEGVLAGYTWTYDPANRITEFTSLLDGTAEYTYDQTDQLVDAEYDYQDDEAYAYDANGNRTMTGYVTGDNNLVLSDGGYDYQYDAEGNRTRRTHIASGEVTEYEWDHRNRLTRVVERESDTGPALKTVEHAYDYLNRWIVRSVDADGHGPLDFTNTYFLYDGTPAGVSLLERATASSGHVGQSVLHFEGDAQGDPQLAQRYLWGPAVDQIIADEKLTEPTAPDNTLWPLTDHLNTVRDLAIYDADTDTTTIVNHLIYNAFGRITSQTDPEYTTLFAFTARPFDKDTGLQNNLNRWYDFATGRWTSEDPIGFQGRDWNLGRYVGNSPVNGIDPLGLLGLADHIAVTDKAVASLAGRHEVFSFWYRMSFYKGCVKPDLEYLHEASIERLFTLHVKLDLYERELMDRVDNLIEWGKDIGWRVGTSVARTILPDSIYGALRWGRNWWQDTSFVTPVANNLEPVLGRLYESHYGTLAWQHGMHVAGWSAGDIRDALVAETAKLIEGARNFAKTGDYDKAAFNLGIALHYVQDTLTASHTEWKDGKICNFQDFRQQSDHLHKQADSVNKGTDAFNRQVARSVILLEVFLNDKLSDQALRTYLRENIYPLHANAVSGGVSPGFEMRND